MNILVINGPNLNMLGKREPEIYGSKTYDDLCDFIKEESSLLNVKVNIVQSNYEGKIIEYIQNTEGFFDGIIINPAAYTHYSFAILDALKSVSTPAIEVHISDIDRREHFRQISVTKAGCIDQLSGLGFEGYILAMKKLLEIKNK